MVPERARFRKPDTLVSAMSRPRHMLAIDQGTTSTRSIVFDDPGGPRRSRGASSSSTTRRPAGSSTTRRTSGATRSRRRAKRSNVRGGRARHRRDRHRQPARNDRRLGARDRRADSPRHRLAGPAHGPACARLRSDGAEALVRPRTGLLLDPYFSGTKIPGCSTMSRAPGRAPSAANSPSAPSTASCSGV